jgi:hypothetical protein
MPNFQGRLSREGFMEEVTHKLSARVTSKEDGKERHPW